MNTAIQITFYEPSLPEKNYTGRLFIDNNGIFFLEADETFIEYFGKVCNIFYATTKFNEKYSLINCVLQTTNFSESLFRVYELYTGYFIGKATIKEFVEIEAVITTLNSWINYSIHKLTVAFQEEGNINIKKPYTFSSKVNKWCDLQINKYSSINSSNDEINLKHKTDLKFVFSEATDRITCKSYIDNFSKILFLFTEEVPQIGKIDFTNSQHEVLTQILFPNIKENSSNRYLIKFSDVEQHFAKAISNFYSKAKIFNKIINLQIQSYIGKIAETSFLNITTAFEIYHENFKPKSEKRQEELFFELFGTLPVNKKDKLWTQNIRLYDIIKSVSILPYFQENIFDLKEIVNLIKNSRNYYTHYNSKADAIWTPAELLKNNKLLRQIIKSLILIELGFPKDAIEKICRANPAFFYYDFNENEYSLNFHEHKL